jgi:hypothetical protein
MADSIEFQTKIKNGIIEIPESYQAQFTDHESVRVILIPEARSKQQPTNRLQALIENPLKIDSFTPLKREEIYERYAF